MAPQAEAGAAAKQPAAVSEANLYEPVAGVLRDEWAKDQRYDDWVVEITARQGCRNTGGKWTRPDLVVVSCSTFLYVPGKHFDVTTFEVKTADAMDVTAVYEALAHLRSATRAYVLLHVTVDEADAAEAEIDQICDEAKRHGVGVIVMAEPGTYESWEERVEPSRQDLNPSRVNEFLSTQMSQGSKDSILKWCR